MEHYRELIFQYGIKNYDFIDGIIDTKMEKIFSLYQTSVIIKTTFGSQNINTDRNMCTLTI